VHIWNEKTEKGSFDCLQCDTQKLLDVNNVDTHIDAMHQVINSNRAVWPYGSCYSFRCMRCFAIVDCNKNVQNCAQEFMAHLADHEKNDQLKVLEREALGWKDCEVGIHWREKRTANKHLQRYLRDGIDIFNTTLPTVQAKSVYKCQHCTEEFDQAGHLTAHYQSCKATRPMVCIKNEVFSPERKPELNTHHREDVSTVKKSLHDASENESNPRIPDLELSNRLSPAVSPIKISENNLLDNSPPMVSPFKLSERKAISTNAAGIQVQQQKKEEDTRETRGMKRTRSSVAASQSPVSAQKSSPAAPQASVATSQSSVAALQSSVDASQSSVTASQSSITALQSSVTASQSSLESPSLPSTPGSLQSKTKIVCTAKMQKAAKQALYQISYVKVKKISNWQAFPIDLATSSAPVRPAESRSPSPISIDMSDTEIDVKQSQVDESHQQKDDMNGEETHQNDDDIHQNDQNICHNDDEFSQNAEEVHQNEEIQQHEEEDIQNDINTIEDMCDYVYFCNDCEVEKFDCAGTGVCNHFNHPRIPIGIDTISHLDRTNHSNLEMIENFVSLVDPVSSTLRVNNLSFSNEYGSVVRREYKRLIMDGSIQENEYPGGRKCLKKGCEKMNKDVLQLFNHIKKYHLKE